MPSSKTIVVLTVSKLSTVPVSEHQVPDASLLQPMDKILPWALFIIFCSVLILFKLISCDIEPPSTPLNLTDWFKSP